MFTKVETFNEKRTHTINERAEQREKINQKLTAITDELEENLGKATLLTHDLSWDVNATDQVTRERLSKIKQYHKKNEQLLNECYALLQTKDFHYDETIPAAVKIDYMKRKNVWHFFLKDGLPHRVKEESSGVYKYSYNREELYSGYKKSIDQLVGSDSMDVFREKAWLYILVHYPEGTRKVDFDNLDVKLFIDTCVKIPFLQDDSPDYLSVIYDSDDKGSGVDVYLGLKEDVLFIIGEASSSGYLE